MDDTIVAIATPLGEGGLGVVRLSGPGAFEIGDRIFRSKTKLAQAPSHTLHHGWIGNIDEVVAALFRSPHSYTGEDVVEFSCHGSPVVLKQVVRLCVAEGARLAKPGEFTERAYLHDKLDLPQAEAVAELIHAQSSRARSAATAQLQGQLSVRINGLREQVISLLAHIEANLDFAEEGIPIIAQDKALKSLDKIKFQIEALLSTSVRGRLIRNGVRVAIAGRPNVGKSSLFNAFLAQERAIVTDIPGTTRDTLEEKIEWDGFPIVLIDTAGLRQNTDPIESEGRARAEKAHANADVVLFVIDGSSAVTDEDRRIARALEGKSRVIALNKADKSIVAEWSSGEIAVKVSAKSGTGLEQLKAAILAAVEPGGNEQESPLVVTNLRHMQHLEEAARRIAHAQSATKNQEPEEAIALDLRAALEEFGHITGEAVTEDVLSAIFRTFCIGK